MHPRVFLETFWRNDLRDEVFVAMSQSPTYEPRWQGLLRPAIEAEPLSGLTLRANRVDTQKSGDSILSSISDGIAHAQIIVADISVTFSWQDGDKERHERNGNVMYEVGLAIATRQPVEIVLVRDDDKPLLFDVSSIPVLKFDPKDNVASILKIRASIADRIGERNLIKDLRVSKTLASLSPFEVNIIKQNRGKYTLVWKSDGGLPPAVAMGVPLLLDKQVLRRADPGPNAEWVYEYTGLGRIVAEQMWRGT